MADWLPTKEQEIDALCDVWLPVIDDEQNQQKYGLNAAACNNVIDKIVNYKDARGEYKLDDSSANRLIKNEAKDILLQAMRHFANTSIRFNDLMEEPLKQLLGITVKDNTPTVHPRPTSQPTTMISSTKNRFEHLIKCVNRETKLASKPADAYGVRYAWQLGGTKPASGNDLPKSRFSRRTSQVITFTEADLGKAVWYATCYENAKGETGPWSAVEETYVA